MGLVIDVSKLKRIRRTYILVYIGNRIIECKNLIFYGAFNQDHLCVNLYKKSREEILLWVLLWKFILEGLRLVEFHREKVFCYNNITAFFIILLEFYYGIVEEKVNKQ